MSWEKLDGAVFDVGPWRISVATAVPQYAGVTLARVHDTGTVEILDALTGTADEIASRLGASEDGSIPIRYTKP